MLKRVQQSDFRSFGSLGYYHYLCSAIRLSWVEFKNRMLHRSFAKIKHMPLTEADHDQPMLGVLFLYPLQGHRGCISIVLFGIPADI